ncbi:thermonuclease family protein [Neobacillus niacini]|uniref:thermonuclease family protein n=1 Tax=Neobacillus niacini TaxID=86668 RepID=UPI00300043DB
MSKRLGGVAVIGAATFLSFNPLPALKDQTVKESSPQVMENPESEVVKGKDLVLTVDQVLVTLVKTIDGDTIKVWINGKIETVRYLLIDTPESKNPNMCVQLYTREAALRNSELVTSDKLTLSLNKKT